MLDNMFIEISILNFRFSTQFCIWLYSKSEWYFILMYLFTKLVIRFIRIHMIAKTCSFKSVNHFVWMSTINHSRLKEGSEYKLPRIWTKNIFLYRLLCIFSTILREINPAVLYIVYKAMKINNHNLHASIFN